MGREGTRVYLILMEPLISAQTTADTCSASLRDCVEMCCVYRSCSWIIDISFLFRPL